MIRHFKETIFTYSFIYYKCTAIIQRKKISILLWICIATLVFYTIISCFRLLGDILDSLNIFLLTISATSFISWLIELILTLYSGYSGIKRPNLTELLKITKSKFVYVGISLYSIHIDNEFFDAINLKGRNDRNQLLEMIFIHLNPDSCFSLQRDGEEGKYPNRTRNEIIITKGKLHDLKDSLNEVDNVRIKTYEYDLMPKYSFIWIDNEMLLVGPYIHFQSGIESDWVLVKKDTELYNQFKRELNIMISGHNRSINQY